MYEIDKVLKVIRDYSAWAKEHPAPGNIDQWWLEALESYLRGELNPTAKWWVERNIEMVLSYGMGNHIKNEDFKWPEDIPKPWEEEVTKPKPPLYEERGRAKLLHRNEIIQEQKDMQTASVKAVHSSYMHDSVIITLGSLFKKKI
ncbi:MAG: hypothetical protein QXS14_05505 [Desulfurococcaceae archaeon]